MRSSLTVPGPARDRRPDNFAPGPDMRAQTGGLPQCLTF